VSEDPASNSSNTEINDNTAVRDAETSSLSIVPETTHSSFGVSPVNIPHDQMRVIENINALISEVGVGLLKTQAVIYKQRRCRIGEKSNSPNSNEQREPYVAHYCLDNYFFFPPILFHLI